MTKAERERLAGRLKRHGVRQPYVVIDEAKRADIKVATLLATLQMETGDSSRSPKSAGFELNQRNIFGCDWGAQGGNPPYCNDEVTEARVAKLLASGRPNGVGWTQLTSFVFVREANQAGGAHIPRYQCRVGARLLRDLFDAQGSIQQMYRAYNGSGPQAEAYGRRAEALRAEWLDVTNGK